MAKSINQKGPVGPVEGRVLQQGGFNTPLGNAVARNVGRGGPGTGRTVYLPGENQRGGQNQYGAANPGIPEPVASRSPDVMNNNRRSGR